MAIKFNRSQTFATNGTVTAPGLHNLVDGLDIYQALITDQTALTSVGTADQLLIADSDLTANDAPRSVTVQELFNDALTSGTYAGAYFTTGTIPTLTIGTTTATRGTITNLNSTTGTIGVLTAGTTTSTGANITTGTVQTLTASTATITGGTFSGSVNATTGTIGTLNSTTGTIGTLNSTTGTIGNLTTTLAGDFTISAGTGTLGTTGVTAGTYGTNTIALTLGVDAKGRISTVGTSTIVTTPADGSITPAKLSGGQTGSAPAYAARAWVNFDGTGTVSIRSSGNVSSITDNGTGDYTINFTTNMPDTNYSAVGSFQFDQANSTGNAAAWLQLARFAQTVSAIRVAACGGTGTAYDGPTVNVVVIR